MNHNTRMNITSHKSYKSLCDNEKRIVINALCVLYDIEKITSTIFVAKLFDFNYRINILKQKDTILAFCIYKRDYRSHAGEIYHVDTLYVLEKGQGYGMQLLNVFKGSMVQLECKVSNKSAQAFYDRLGLKKRAYSYIGED